MNIYFMLLRLLTAHILADFFLQPHSWIVRRRERGIKAPVLYFHAIIVGVLSWLFLGFWHNFSVAIFIMVTHFFIDWWKSARPDTMRFFIIDQVLHLVMIFLAWLWFTHGQLILLYDAFNVFSHTGFWVVATGYLLVLQPFSIIVNKFIRKWQQPVEGQFESTGSTQGLPEAGKWIGYLERILILTLILVQQFAAIGFLITAKSIFRFGEITGKRGRAEAEYVLIGSFISFTMSILLGIVVKALL